MTRPKGLFIAFEGGEGAGKSTLTAAIADALTEQGIEVVKTREPGMTPLGERVREILLHSHQDFSLCAKAELLLFLAARAQNIEEIIKPALERGACVLCDRFNDSTIAYQGWARGLGLQEVEQLCLWVCESSLPDITFFLSVDPRVGLERTRKVSKLDRIESESDTFHTLVQEGFQKIAFTHPEHFTFIDAGKEKKIVFADVWNVIAAQLKL